MKNYILLFALFFAMKGMAQSNSFYEDKWKTLEIKSSFHKHVTSLFHRDSLQNSLDYSKYEIKFYRDGSYKGTVPSGASYQGTWWMNNAKDTVSIDNSLYKIVLLTSNHFVLRTYSFQLADTLGNMDTVTTDFTMYSIPDITTSLQEATFGSASVKIFPNPVKDMLEVSLVSANTPLMTELRLANIHGQIMKVHRPDKNDKYTSVSTVGFSPGIYTLEILDGEGRRIAIQKIIKE